MSTREPTEVRTCTGCGLRAPDTESDFTLIGAKYGWRLRRYMHHTTQVSEWWCPTCWVELKKNVAGDPPSQSFAVAKKT